MITIHGNQKSGEVSPVDAWLGKSHGIYCTSFFCIIQMVGWPVGISEASTGKFHLKGVDDIGPQPGSIGHESSSGICEPAFWGRQFPK